MRIKLHYGFEQKMLVQQRGSWRGSYETYFAQGQIEVDVKDVALGEFVLAARISDPLLKAKHTPETLKQRQEPAEFFWREGQFWIDQGPVANLAGEPGNKYGVGAFRCLNVHKNEKLSQRPTSYFKPSAVKEKVALATSKARAAAARVVIAGDRLFEVCAEPVLLLASDGEITGIGFAPVGPEEDVDISATSVGGADYPYDYKPKSYARLFDANGEAPDGVDNLWTDVFRADLDPGYLMNRLRRSLSKLTECSRNMPVSHLLATRRLFDADGAAWITPTGDVVQRVQEIVDLGLVPDAETNQLRQDEAYRRNHVPEVHSDPTLNMANTVERELSELAKLIEPMHAFLADRLNPTTERPILGIRGKENEAIMRRVETPGEVFRCARIAGEDPLKLLASVEAGEVDVIAIELGGLQPCQKYEFVYTPASRVEPIVGVRLVRAATPDAPQHYFGKKVELGLRLVAKTADFPSFEFAAPLPEMKL